MISSIVTFAVVLAIVLLILKILGKSIKILGGILINAIVGFFVLAVLKALGVGVAINWISALIVGLLGIPGVILVVVLQVVFKVLL